MLNTFYMGGQFSSALLFKHIYTRTEAIQQLNIWQGKKYEMKNKQAVMLVHLYIDVHL